MIDDILAMLAPHYCCGCGEIGAILCEHCKNDIIEEAYSVCLECGLPTPVGNIHASCRLPYEKAWCVAERSGATKRLINSYKFEYGKAAHKALADLLDATLPELPSDTVIVPIPTISRHVRQRGYDHIDLICRRLARKRKLKLSKVLKRRNNSVQHGAARRQRILQAAEAFEVDRPLSIRKPHLLIDDIATTGSTLRYAAKELRAGGVESVWVAVIARQTIDS